MPHSLFTCFIFTFFYRYIYILVLNILCVWCGVLHVCRCRMCLTNRLKSTYMYLNILMPIIRVTPPQKTSSSTATKIQDEKQYHIVLHCMRSIARFRLCVCRAMQWDAREIVWYKWAHFEVEKIPPPPPPKKKKTEKRRKKDSSQI